MSSSFGHWEYDSNGLPVFVLTAQDNVAADAKFTHLIATGKASALLDRHANIQAPGEGENAGIWPQTVYWFIWALCERGLKQQAMDVWRRMSLYNHTDKFPDVPFGIFNGPDCYSSQFSQKTYGATQTDLIDRRGTVPMNPVIAWQAWSLDMILND